CGCGWLCGRHLCSPADGIRQRIRASPDRQSSAGHCWYMAYTNQAPVSVRVMTVDQAFAERQAILDQIGDEQCFRQRGQNFELDAEELVLYDDLKTLDFLLAERYKQRSEQVPAKSKRQQKKDAQLLRRLQSAISDIEIAQTDLILAMQK